MHLVDYVCKITPYVLFFAKNDFDKRPKRRFKPPKRKRFAHRHYSVCTFFV